MGPRWTFSYIGGRRAKNGAYELPKGMAEKIARNLSLEKGRAIVLRRERYVYETERYHGHNLSGMDMPVGTVFEPYAIYEYGKLKRRL